MRHFTVFKVLTSSYFLHNPTATDEIICRCWMLELSKTEKRAVLMPRLTVYHDQYFPSSESREAMCYIPESFQND